MNEEIYKFGERNDLVGNVTYPGSEYKNHDLPAIILLNAGLLHRVGPYRLNVELARNLASKGFKTLRFDMSRKGDSGDGSSVKTYMQLAASDISSAMDFMTKETEVKTFVLIGLCSGADTAHPTAVSDKRVSGVVYLDGCGYRTSRYYMHFYAKRLSRGAFKPSKWKKFIKKKYSEVRLENRLENRIDMSEDEFLSRQFPSKEKSKADILHMMERGVNLLYVYTGGVQGYYTYHTQFEDMFGIKVKKYKDILQLEYFEESDHIYSIIEDRMKLINVICDWMRKHYSVK